MLIRKVDKRITQYLTFFQKKMYLTVSELTVLAGKTKKIYNTVPSDIEMKEIIFPYFYGEEKTNWWFFSSWTCPDEYMNGGHEIYLYAPTGSDSLVFINGKPSAGVNPFHTKVKLTNEEKQGRNISFAIESYSGHTIPGFHPFSTPKILVTINTQIQSYPIKFPIMKILMKNKIIYDLYFDALTLFDLAQQLIENSLRKNKILQGLYNALIHIHFISDETTLIKEASEASIKIKQLLEKRNSETTPNIFSIGHAHIDHAWLWTLLETKRKAARTFANMTRYMKEYPEFIFIQSQPAQLEMIKETYPDIFREVINAYENNQWEPNGGMYIEADCNITGGESLIRQFIYGKKLTKQYFNYQSDTLWLPDVFGYPGSLPQILKGCGIKNFVSMKIIWNDTTRFPYDTFFWSGIDKSRIRTHFLTTSYSGKNTPRQIFESWNRVQHKEIQDSLIRAIGEGDGGGGTLRSDIELMRRMSDLEGCPRNKWSKISESLNTIFSNANVLPIWNGELYLEFHRGTYTTMAKLKYYNRKLEHKLRNIEFLSVICDPNLCEKMGFNNGIEYQKGLISNNWKKLLTNQFHDILPGSSINQVNNEAIESYKTINLDLINLENSILRIFSNQIGNEIIPKTLLVFNSLSWDRLAYISLPKGIQISLKHRIKDGSVSYPIQLIKDINGIDKYISLISIPSLGYAQGKLIEEETKTPSPFDWENNTLITPYYKVNFDKSMQIVGLQRISDENSSYNFVLPDTSFNQIQIAEDVPCEWDAWDIDLDYELKLKNLPAPQKWEIISTGPLIFQIRFNYMFNKSKIIQDIIFYSHCERIDFSTLVNWQEDHKLLKTIFPVNIQSNTIKCEIQFGHINRSTNKNRDHERAMFEFCAHKWISIDDGSRCFSLLNDSKYGHNITDNIIGLTLLRSPKIPDPQADMGEHLINYSILPFNDSFNVEKVVRNAYELNSDIIVTGGSVNDNLFKENYFLKCSNSNVIVESIKQAEDDDSIIIRFYEASGTQSQTNLTFICKFNLIYETNMLEENIMLISEKSDKIELTLHPFEIKTIKLVYK